MLDKYYTLNYWRLFLAPPMLYRAGRLCRSGRVSSVVEMPAFMARARPEDISVRESTATTPAVNRNSSLEEIVAIAYIR